MKKTIIAASLTALAMGPGFVGASEHAVEGQPITVDGKGDLSPNSEMKLIGGWHYDKNTEKTILTIVRATLISHSREEHLMN